MLPIRTNVEEAGKEVNQAGGQGEVLEGRKEKGDSSTHGWQPEIDQGIPPPFFRFNMTEAANISIFYGKNDV